MYSRVSLILALILIAVAVPGLHASNVAFTYAGPTVGSATYSGAGSFSFPTGLTSVGLVDLTAFSFTLDLFATGQIPNPAEFQYGLADLTAFSATISGNTVTALSLTTGFEAADNTSNFDENQKGLVVNSLAVGDAPLYNQTDIPTVRTTLIGNGTITVGSVTPEPSTALLAGAAGLLLVFGRLRFRTRRG